MHSCVKRCVVLLKKFFGVLCTKHDQLFFFFFPLYSYLSMGALIREGNLRISLLVKCYNWVFRCTAVVLFRRYYGILIYIYIVVLWCNVDIDLDSSFLNNTVHLHKQCAIMFYFSHRFLCLSVSKNYFLFVNWAQLVLLNQLSLFCRSIMYILALISHISH